MSIKEKIKENEGEVSINFPDIGQYLPKFPSKLKKGFFWFVTILLFGFPALVWKTYIDFMHIDEDEEDKQ